MTDNRKQKKENSGEKYNPGEIELKWQAKWEAEKTYQPDLDTATSSASGTENKTLPGARQAFYNLMMFPYPSAEGLHVGNMYAFTGADVYGRFKRMTGHTVFQPIGLDGFGIHSENYALKVGSHPMEQVEVSEENYYRQLRSIGNGYDWSHTVETYKPDYYRWTQWVFVQLFKAGLAYRAAAEVNWCPSCQTVLADEQVIQKVKRQKAKGKNKEESIEMSVGVCERCDTEVEKRNLEQWFFRITGYAERLLQDLDTIDWTEKVKLAQRNWIGKSEGAVVKFLVPGSQFVGEATAKMESPQNEESIATNSHSLEVFTTRPDTLHGATFMVVSPEHPLVDTLLRNQQTANNNQDDNDTLQAVRAYVEQAKGMSDRDRNDASKEKTGVFSGLYAENPVNGQQIPIWIADYVLMGYGTGAIMAVPAHDQRDYEFAKKYDLPIVEVITGGDITKEAYAGNGVLVNSGDWNGWSTENAKQQAITWLEERKVGQKETNYHLRDWLISRQRYWGAPIPMIYCETCAAEGKSWFTTDEANSIRHSKLEFRNSTSADVFGWYPEENLPVLLPHIDDYRPVGTGKAPLANHPEFYETTCPGCGSPAKRETDVSDTFLDSSWYFLRYPATDLKHIPFPMKASELQSFKASEQEERVKAEKRMAWLPVSQYIGGAEHSVLHLLYARFVYKVFVDLGYLDVSKGEEPFPKFFAHGLIIKEGAKMSKSKGNVVVPDLYIKKYGADTLRTYLMFLGPFSEGGDFQDAGIDGINRFLRRVWKLFTTTTVSSSQDDHSANSLMHRTIKGVSSDMSSLRYNTAIAKLMTWYNALSQQEVRSEEEVLTYLKLLAPFAPHMTEELYQRIRNRYNKGVLQAGDSSEAFSSIHTSSWPVYDEAFLIDQTVTIAIQVNGKLRDTVTVQKEISGKQEEVEKMAKASEKVQTFINGKDIKKVIYIPGKILNFVV